MENTVTWFTQDKQIRTIHNPMKNYWDGTKEVRTTIHPDEAHEL